MSLGVSTRFNPGGDNGRDDAGRADERISLDQFLRHVRSSAYSLAHILPPARLTANSASLVLLVSGTFNMPTSYQ